MYGNQIVIIIIMNYMCTCKALAGKEEAKLIRWMGNKNHIHGGQVCNMSVGGALIFSQLDRPAADGRTRMSRWMDGRVVVVGKTRRDCFASHRNILTLQPPDERNCILVQVMLL